MRFFHKNCFLLAILGIALTVPSFAIRSKPPKVPPGCPESFENLFNPERVADEVIERPITNIPTSLRDSSGTPWTAYSVSRKFYEENHIVEVNTIEYRQGLPKEFETWVRETYGFWISDVNKPFEGKIPSDLPLEIPDWFQQSSAPLTCKMNLLILDHLLSRWSPGKNKEKIQAEQKESLDFALQHYSRRKFATILEELKENAEIYWDASTYINVLERTDNGEKGELLGTLRLISYGPDVHNRYKELYPHLPDVTQVKKKAKWSFRLPYGLANPILTFVQRLLPVEKFFKAIFPRPSAKLRRKEKGVLEWDKDGFQHLFGEAIEPGNFAIRKDCNPAVFKKIFISLLRATFDPKNSPEYNLRGKVFYTYGDKVGCRLYESLGFEKMKDFAPVETDDGIKMWLLWLTPDRFQRTIDSLSSRPLWTQAETGQLRRLMSRLTLGHRARSQE